jgi:hypothetical protein
MHLHSPVKIASFALVLALPAIPAVSHAQVTAALTGSGTVHASSSTGSASGGLKVEVGAPLIVTRASAKADLNATATGSAMATTASDERASLKQEANRIATADERVASVSLSAKDVAVSYREPAKFLGFIRVDVPVTVRIEADGATHVSYPWYSFLFSSNQAGLAIRAEAAAKNALGADATSSTTLSAAAQARLLNSIHGVLESNAEASATETSFLAQ